MMDGVDLIRQGKKKKREIETRNRHNEFHALALFRPPTLTKNKITTWRKRMGDEWSRHTRNTNSEVSTYIYIYMFKSLEQYSAQTRNRRGAGYRSRRLYNSRRRQHSHRHQQHHYHQQQQQNQQQHSNSSVTSNVNINNGKSNTNSSNKVP